MNKLLIMILLGTASAACRTNQVDNESSLMSSKPLSNEAQPDEVVDATKEVAELFAPNLKTNIESRNLNRGYGKVVGIDVSRKIIVEILEDWIKSDPNFDKSRLDKFSLVVWFDSSESLLDYYRAIEEDEKKIFDSKPGTSNPAVESKADSLLLSLKYFVTYKGRTYSLDIIPMEIGGRSKTCGSTPDFTGLTEYRWFSRDDEMNKILDSNELGVGSHGITLAAREHFTKTKGSQEIAHSLITLGLSSQKALSDLVSRRIEKGLSGSFQKVKTSWGDGRCLPFAPIYFGSFTNIARASIGN